MKACHKLYWTGLGLRWNAVNGRLKNPIVPVPFCQHSVGENLGQLEQKPVVFVVTSPGIDLIMPP